MLSDELFRFGVKVLSVGLLGWFLLRIAYAAPHGVCDTLRFGMRALVIACALQAVPHLSGAAQWGAHKVQAWQQLIAIHKPQAVKSDATVSVSQSLRRPRQTSIRARHH